MVTIPKRKKTRPTKENKAKAKAKAKLTGKKPKVSHR